LPLETGFSSSTEETKRRNDKINKKTSIPTKISLPLSDPGGEDGRT
jgi:hypothetical protein